MGFLQCCHIMGDGQERPVAYDSRTLTAAEKNYSQFEKEALGVVFEFHNYLYGREFIIESDHHPLSFILVVPKLSHQLFLLVSLDGYLP